MNKRWYSVIITAVIVLGTILTIKYFPWYATLYSAVAFIAGFIAGYLFKKKEVQLVEVEKTVEKIVEVKPKKKVKSKQTKEETI